MNVDRANKDPSALVVHATDDVAVLTSNARAGDTIRLRGVSNRGELVALDAIATGHKVNIRKMRAGDLVRKYGEVIGQLTSDAEAGSHIHIHNLVSLRAGEKAAETDDTTPIGYVARPR